MIKKYELKRAAGFQSIEMPSDSEILEIGPEPYNAVFITVVTEKPDGPKKIFDFLLVQTGDADTVRIPDNFAFVGSHQTRTLQTWNVFAPRCEPEPPEESMPFAQSDKVDLPPRVHLADLLLLGILQEVNRTFFHPLGMALAVDYQIGALDAARLQIVDSRDDPEGMGFATGAMSREQYEAFQKFAAERIAPRKKALGYVVQPPPEIAGFDGKAIEIGLDEL